MKVAIDQKFQEKFEKNPKQHTEEHADKEERQRPKKDCPHPQGLKQRLAGAGTIEEALGVLCAASNEERKVRSRVREASTLFGALDALLEFENLSEEEEEGEYHFNDFQDWEFYVMSEDEGGNTAKATTTDAEENQESTEDEVDKEVRELNREPKPKKRSKKHAAQVNRPGTSKETCEYEKEKASCVESQGGVIASPQRYI